MPHFSFPSSLPISAHVEEIVSALRTHPVVIVSGDTGSGKTTQLPKICLRAGRGRCGLIGVTQPRRLACLAMARRVAEEFGEEVGKTVGYQHRFDKRLSRDTAVKFMTDGILLAETRRDRLFRAYDTLVIDEAHERSLNIDFLLGILHQVLPHRPDLKLIISSATLDVQRFSDFFNGAPIVSVPGRLYPIETRWRPAEDAEDADLPRQVADAVDEMAAEGEGDILVFLPGERDIREAQEVLSGRRLPRTEIIPLLASLPAGEQQRAFQTSSNRRVILSTNVAETSVTIPGIRYVIDSGLARLNRYNPRTHVQRLQIEPISQASANQRQGRCGRVAPGVCIRLYDEEDFRRRDAFTPPEILRSSLAGVILTMLDLRLGDIAAFPFIDPPSGAAVRDGYAELEVLGAVGNGEKDAGSESPLTPLGRKLARLPLEPAFGRILFAAAAEGVLEEALIVVASLECDDPRRRPIDQREEADRLHARFLTPVSDFSGILRLWRWYHDPVFQDSLRPGGPSHKQVSAAPLSQSALRRLCKGNFLSYPKMRDWCDLRDQLADLCADLGLKNATIAERQEHCVPSGRENEKAGFSIDAALHRALLAGLVTNIGHRDPETGDYRGTRSIRFALFPGSGLAKLKLPKPASAQEKRPRPVRGSLPTSREWVLAGDLMETSRLFARTAACIDPAWIEPLARPICKYSYHSASWDPIHGFVRVKERVMLLGLLLSDGRTRDDSRIHPEEAREIFLRQGLVDGAFPKPVPAFLVANLARTQALLDAEEKTRQHGLLFDPETAFSFYDARLPAEVNSAPALRAWLSAHPDVSLTMEENDLPPVRDMAADFPDAITLNGTRLPLTYRHAPGEEEDGVTCTVPAALLRQVAAWRSDWLVPGMLDEKLHWMFTALPTRQRRLLIPLNETVERVRTHLTPGRGAMTDAVSRAIYEICAVRIPPETWKDDDLPDHLRMRFRVVENEEEDAKVLGCGRNLAPLLALFSPKGGAAATDVRVSSPGVAGNAYHRDHVTTWDFGDLPAAVNVGSAGWPVVHTPSLVANDDGTVSLRLLSDPAAAAAAHEAGVCRLFSFALGKDGRRLAQPPRMTADVTLYLQSIGSTPAQFGAELATAALREAFVEGQPAVRSGAEFTRRLISGRARISSVLAERTRLALAILFAASEVEDALKPRAAAPKGRVSDFASLAQSFAPVSLPDDTVADLADQLAWLVFPGFAGATPGARLAQLPRYLEACRVRIERCRTDGAADLRKARQVGPYWRKYTAFLEKEERPRYDAAALAEYRWLVEEFRVSLFAQELRTPVPVSAKRLDVLWDKVLNA